MKSRPVVLAAVVAILCACARQAPAPASNATAPARKPARTVPSHASPPGAAQPWTDASWGFRIDAPPGWTIHRDFAHGYLANDSWKTYATPGSHGTAIVSFTLPGSDEITSAEIRIGASRDANEIAQCTAAPESLRSGSVHRERIGGEEFTAFDAADAAMSHHLYVRGHRIVHAGTCYAIDLLVYGTNPQVYDPPPKPPFSGKQAFARMMPVLRTFRFTR
ncbi:MAG TPA: hypothetical protein VGK80_13035 [Rhodanobacteraceae bacterium]